MTASLSENHRRGISSTLGLLDEMLCRFERWAKGDVAQGVLYQEHDTLSGSQRQAILKDIAALRRLMAELRDTLGLEIKAQDVAGAIWSQSLAFWEALVELEAKYLKRYGDLPEGFAKEFDPKVQRIIQHVIRIADAANRAP